MISKKELIEIFEDVIDPEINIDIWTMGLIYDYKIEKDRVWIKMTFTTPTCPFGPELIEEIKSKVLNKGLEFCDIDITFEPPWKPSEDLKEMLGIVD
ncbi:DUF59 domain-containing protein [Candidatus Woesearchaeota archaeon]|jgi:metal-sulfur cluster biosynthetic enzyme|nr:DUF59 domain-containing protein [Candidatus Woesearchaeota archaeon]MBT4387084.1 DUF59 domain-containing protein [Candidatus Woesearchaeota archaeon]MBT4596159.1 DUF59 domain-containing protein [Candidatus Woesearchaeota archaeon]MBT5741618.1 DUF59 domain-containing protein [Candidatus Woesearchaeota archaeon]MBT6505266.1 DUF59 domain-containing protein [Candidatus Woesearchaeota archaeon]